MNAADQDIGYYAFTDPAARNFMRFGVTTDPPGIESAYWDASSRVWVEDMALADFVVFRPNEIAAMTAGEAAELTGGRHADPVARAVTPVPFDPTDPHSP